MVEESEEMEAENVIDYTETLREALAPGVTIEYLHGKMKPKEKNDVMERFANGEISVLVSTTVVEVGVNVPNATVMMVENAQRFGLAQLHQLRGRVGRGKYQSYCIFVCDSNSKEAWERLEILNKSNDGFLLQEKIYDFVGREISLESDKVALWNLKWQISLPMPNY
jgi:RecG-like helicase